MAEQHYTHRIMTQYINLNYYKGGFLGFPRKPPIADDFVKITSCAISYSESWMKHSAMIGYHGNSYQVGVINNKLGVKRIKDGPSTTDIMNYMKIFTPVLKEQLKPNTIHYTHVPFVTFMHADDKTTLVLHHDHVNPDVQDWTIALPFKVTIPKGKVIQCGYYVNFKHQNLNENIHLLFGIDEGRSVILLFKPNQPVLTYQGDRLNEDFFEWLNEINMVTYQK